MTAKDRKLQRLLGFPPRDKNPLRPRVEDWLLTFLSSKWGIVTSGLTYFTPVERILVAGGDKNDLLGIYVAADCEFGIKTGVAVDKIKKVGDIVNYILQYLQN